MMILTKKKYSLIDSLKITFKVAPISSTLLVVLQLMGNALIPISVFIVANFLDTVHAHQLGDATANHVLISLVPLFLFFIFDWTWFSFLGLCDAKMENAFNVGVAPLILQKKAQLDYMHFENGEIVDLIQRIDQNNFLEIFRNIISFIGFCVKLIGIIFIIFYYVWWAAILIVVFFIPNVILSAKSGKANYQAVVDISERQRKANYLSELFESRESAGERILFQYSENVNGEWKKEYNTSIKRILKTKLFWDLRQRLSSLSIVFLTFIIMVTLMFPTLDGTITIGLYIALVGNCSVLAFKMQWMFIGKLENMVRDSAYCREFTTFMSLSGDSEYTMLPKFADEFINIEFKDVHFTYPGTQKKILNGVTFNMESGKHYALVGNNGSGKSTIIKLLTGLYVPDAGEILINGVNIKEFKYQELVGFYSVVLQDFARYNINIRDNLIVSDLQNYKSDHELDEILREVDLFDYVYSLSANYDTDIGKINEGGIDISGGQWQKLALGRSLHRPSQFYILDEPTASLSPSMESSIYERFSDITKNKTVLLISHRLGSTKLADTIFVLDEGIIKEQGNRDALLERRGLYFEMFSNQKEWYQ